MLASQEFDYAKIKYPCYCTPKIDGIRAVHLNRELLSRSLKPIPNRYIREWAADNLPDNCDGELVALKDNGDVASFQETTSLVMSHEKKGKFKYIMFDYMIDYNIGYVDRMYNMHEQVEQTKQIQLLLPTTVRSKEELTALNLYHLDLGHEGTIIRSDSIYKHGRSTLREGYMIKMKQWTDDEAVVLSFEEKMTNTSSIINELGLKDKTSKKEDLVPANTLGALVCDYKGNELSIGSGFDDATRQEIWNNKYKYAGKIVKFKYFDYGIKTLPRHPVFLGFRSPLDL